MGVTLQIAKPEGLQRTPALQAGDGGDGWQFAVVVRNWMNWFNSLYQLLRYVRVGTGAPNGAVTGSPGNLFLRTDGGAGTTLYVKESGLNTSTGWVGK